MTAADHDELLAAVQGLGETREPDADARARAREIDPADWHGMRGPDDVRHPEAAP